LSVCGDYVIMTAYIKVVFIDKSKFKQFSRVPEIILPLSREF